MDTLQNENLTGINREGSHPNVPLKYLSATSILRDKVHNEKGEHMGKITDIMIDITTGKIEYVVIEFGGFLTIGEKYFAIPFGMLKVDPVNKAFLFSQPREMLEKAPGFDMNHWPETNFHAEETYWSFV
ncbi:MAG TPA: PRC-barrel domain-containing protein [Chitinophagaceae bacterium]|nr:PRC-barrel domain-containing protein [Chitinophagaceae bacterium]